MSRRSDRVLDLRLVLLLVLMFFTVEDILSTGALDKGRKDLNIGSEGYQKVWYKLHRKFVRLLFESGYYSRAAFIKLSGIGKIFCKCKGFEKSQFYKINKELRCSNLVLKQNF